MAFHMVDTPHSEAAEKTLLSHAAELDFSTVNSIPSPSKDSNLLLKNIRAKRGINLNTPRARAPLGDRRNAPSKGEFTPLLKSAAKNRIMQLGGSNKENSHLETPAGLRPTCNDDSPALPFHSSILLEEHTGSSLDVGDGQGTPIPPVSSSLMSTPMPTLPTRRDGILDDNANLLTLREQEARLIQIDKENFSLKLKIHFMEEALRRNGKEFNEAAIRENTELKVDKVTLQRDLRQYRKSLAQAEKDLEDYRRQLIDYAEKVKRRHAAEGMQEEFDQMKQLIVNKDSEIEELRQLSKASGSHDQQVEALKADIDDLEAELRERDRLLEEKDDDVQLLQDQIRARNNGLEDQLHEKERLLESKDDQIDRLKHDLRDVETSKDELRRGKYSEIASANERLQSLQQQLEEIRSKRSNSLSTKDQDIIQRDQEIDDLRAKLFDAEVKAAKVEDAQNELNTVRNEMEAELRRKSRALDGKDQELHALQSRLDSIDSKDEDFEKMQDDICDLQQEIREKDRIIEEKEGQIDALKDLDEALLAAHDRVHELEMCENRGPREVKDSQDSGYNAENQLQPLTDAEGRARELEKREISSTVTLEQLHQETDKLRDEISLLRQERDVKEGEFVMQRDLWETQRQSLEVQISQAEDQIKSLQQSLDSHKQVQAYNPGHETEHQRALDDLQKEKDDEEQLFKEKIENLEDEVEVLQNSLDEMERVKDDLEVSKQEAERLRRQVEGLQQDIAEVQNEPYTRKSGQKSPSLDLSTNEMNKTIEDLQEKLCRVRKERNDLHARLVLVETIQSNTKADIDTLQIDLDTASSSRAQLQQQVKDLREELRTTQRDSQRKLAESERDINNLEQDLANTQSKQHELVGENQSSNAHITRLNSKIQGLERDLAAARSNSRVPRTMETVDASTLERKDLHALLKDAKLEAEDLALRVRDRDARLNSIAAKETELLVQIKRLRDERTAQASRADEAGRELEHLHNQHEHLADDLASMRQQLRQAHFSARGDGSKTEKRHLAELRGLTRQIEYLSARVRREETFRRDLSYSKMYFLKQVEMYTACNAVDLRLVEAMGISSAKILEEEQSSTDKKVIRLRSVAWMVIAMIRMKNCAERWSVVKGRHDGVLKKLEDVRKARAQTKKNNASLKQRQLY